MALAFAFEFFHEFVAVVDSGGKAADEQGCCGELFKGAFFVAAGFGVTEHSDSP